MESKSLVLLLVGLLIGGGSCYFLAHNQLQSQYDELESSYEELLEQYELLVASLEYVEEELVTRTFTFDHYGVARTTLNVREKATVSGTYSRSPAEYATSFSIQITAPDQETIIWAETGSSSGSFRFIADVGGSYIVIIQNGLPDEIIVQFTASQSYQKTIS